MSLPNFTWEAGRLLCYVGRVATAIRMNTPYSGAYDPRAPHHADDVMWLADSLHHFERLGQALQVSDLQAIEDTCNDLLSIYSDYESRAAGVRPDPAATFERQTTFRLNEGRAILLAIRDEARQWRTGGSANGPEPQGA